MEYEKYVDVAARIKFSQILSKDLNFVDYWYLKILCSEYHVPYLVFKL